MALVNTEALAQLSPAERDALLEALAGIKKAEKTAESVALAGAERKWHRMVENFRAELTEAERAVVGAIRYDETDGNSVRFGKRKRNTNAVPAPAKPVVVDETV